MNDQVRVFDPIPRQSIVLPPAPAYGPLVIPADWADGDRSMARYFWTSTEKDEQAFTCDELEIRRIINYGMKAQPIPHGTPYGHGELTIHVSRLPIPIGEQMIRARVMKHSKEEDGGEPSHLIYDIDWKPNVSKKSFRYVKLAGGTLMVMRDGMTTADRARELFYVPRAEDIMGEDGRPGHYVRLPLPERRREEEVERFERVYAYCLREYEEAIAEGEDGTPGVAGETARFLLPQGAYTTMYATESYRNWFNFCLARNDPHAQQEIRWIGAQVETILAQCAPITYELWLSHGRRMI